MVMEVNGGEICISGMYDQPVFVKLQHGTEEWLTIGQLSYGMELYNPMNNSWTNVSGISLRFGNFTVYDVQTGQMFHIGMSVRSDYMANGFLVDRKAS